MSHEKTSHLPHTLPKTHTHTPHPTCIYIYIYTHYCYHQLEIFTYRWTHTYHSNLIRQLLQLNPYRMAKKWFRGLTMPFSAIEESNCSRNKTVSLPLGKPAKERKGQNTVSKRVREERKSSWINTIKRFWASVADVQNQKRRRKDRKTKDHARRGI